MPTCSPTTCGGWNVSLRPRSSDASCGYSRSRVCITPLPPSPSEQHRLVRRLAILPRIPRIYISRQSMFSMTDNAAHLMTINFQDPLRRRFGNTLQFYNCLKDSVVFTLDKVTTSIRNPVPPPMLVSFEEDDPETDCDEPNARDSLFTATPLAQRPTSTPRNPQKRHRDEPDTEEEDADLDGSPFPDPPARERPSEYLRARCPCCFGGEFPREGLMG